MPRISRRSRASITRRRSAKEPDTGNGRFSGWPTNLIILFNDLVLSMPKWYTTVLSAYSAPYLGFHRLLSLITRMLQLGMFYVPASIITTEFPSRRSGICICLWEKQDSKPYSKYWLFLTLFQHQSIQCVNDMLLYKGNHDNTILLVQVYIQQKHSFLLGLRSFTVGKYYVSQAWEESLQVSRMRYEILIHRQ